MRLLVDANLRASCQRLRKAGHDASHVVDHGLLEADDNAIMAFAAQESAVVVSADSDFASMPALRRIAAWAEGRECDDPNVKSPA